MLLLGQIVVFLVVVLLCKRWLNDLKYRHFPGPSPFLSLPLLGHGYLLGAEPCLKMLEYMKTYGDIFRFDIGDTPTVLLCKYDEVKEAYTKDSFNGRYWNEIPIFKAVSQKDHEGNIY